LSKTPFAIGRAADCQLMLPDNPDLRKTTSRWHCHIVEEKTGPVLVDGSLNPLPETGARKASVTGTKVNGVPLTGPHKLKNGDQIVLGPWAFSVQTSDERPLNIDGILSRLDVSQAQAIEAGDPRVGEGFNRLNALAQKLNGTADVEKNLASILDCALAEIGGAQVAALLLDAPDGGCSTRIAWQRGLGRIFDFPFSSDLVRRLPQDRSFFLGSQIRDNTKSQILEKISSALLVPLWGNGERLGILYMDNRGQDAAFKKTDLYLAHALASYASFHLLLEKNAFLARVEDNMSHYFGAEVVRVILEEARKGRPVLPEVKEQKASIIFVDLEGFSRFCRGRSPREISDLLNPYFQIAAECIQRHSGYVDKFIGDGVLGVFGAQPFESQQSTDSHAVQAVRAAREIIRLWAGRPAQDSGMRLPLRAGIDTGDVVIGNIGFAARMEYSVLGDTVNLAARLEKLAEPNAIAMTDATRRLLGAEFACVDGGEEAVKGFGNVRVWRLAL
jgi:class 3 adenylate cyclase